jgi:hypothetical protein
MALSSSIILRQLLSIVTDRENLFRDEKGRYDLLQLSPVSLDVPVLEAAMVEGC